MYRGSRFSVPDVDVTLLYFDDCPNWKFADRRLVELASEGLDITVTRREVHSAEEAERLGFHGSPSILLDGVDLFPAPRAVVGLTCRVYSTPDGLAGVPTLDQLRAVLACA